MSNFFHKLWKRWNWVDRIVPNNPTFDYACNWDIKKRKVYEMCDHCAFQPWRKASVIHHLKYTRSNLRIILEYLFLGHDFGRSVSGYEIPMIDIVPVSKECHENYYGSSKSKMSVHFTGDESNDPYWIKQPKSIDNHQSPTIALRLRLTFFLFSGGWVVSFFPAIAYFFYLITSRN